MQVFQTSPYVTAFFCSNKFALMLATSVKMLYTIVSLFSVSGFATPPRTNLKVVWGDRTPPPLFGSKINSTHIAGKCPGPHFPKVFYKVLWTVITNCDSFFFITKCHTVCYKLRQLLQSAEIITNCDSTFIFLLSDGGNKSPLPFIKASSPEHWVCHETWVNMYCLYIVWLQENAGQIKLTYQKQDFFVPLSYDNGPIISGGNLSLVQSTQSWLGNKLLTQINPCFRSFFFHSRHSDVP